jgi:hypothetical protein
MAPAFCVLEDVVLKLEKISEKSEIFDYTD